MTLVIVLGVLNRIVFNKSEISEIKVSEISEAKIKTDYQIGFEEGFNAFINQSGEVGLPYPPLEFVAKYSNEFNNNTEYQYTSSYSNEEKNKGYVDGYHRATKALNCPW